MAVTVLVLVNAASAAAAPAWLIDSNTNTNAEPGGTIAYHLQLTNIGDSEADGTGGDPIVFTVELPPELTVSEVKGRLSNGSSFDWSLFGWNCSGDGPGDPPNVVGARNLTCAIAASAPAPHTAPIQPLVIVDVAGEASGALEAAFTLSGAGAGPASTFEATRIATGPPLFGIDSFDAVVTADAAGNPYTQAGGHPYGASVTTDFNTTTHPDPSIGPLWPVASPRNLELELPPGFVGDPLSAALCDSGNLANNGCPPDAQVGTVLVRFSGKGFATQHLGPLPVFNMEPPPHAPARIGFTVYGTVVSLDAELRSAGDYGLTMKAAGLSQGLAFSGSTVTLWGVPADDVHTPRRACPGVPAPEYTPDPGPTCANGGPLLPFLRNPTSCTAPGVGLPLTLRVDSWTEPGKFVEDTLVTHDTPGYPRARANWGSDLGTTGCGEVPFDPALGAAPVEPASAGAPSGFTFDLSIPQTRDPDVVGQSDLRKAVVTLPEGVRVSPASAQGLGTCSEAQIALDSTAPATCPNPSKISDVVIETPLLAEPLSGAVYLATPFDNPFDSLLSLYLVANGPGLTIKLPGKVDTDPRTGQLTATFDDNPQLPFSNLHLEFKSGPRAPLTLPNRCGTYTTHAELTGWNGRTVSSESSFTLSENSAGGCEPGFTPGFHAGTENPLAGATSPFLLRLTREDTDQELSGLTAQLPPGLSGYLKGIPYCPDSALAGVSGDQGTAAAQIASPACPAGSQIGSVVVGAGAGSSPFYVQTGKAYLAGPYKGAPLSLAIVTPALAGPFDLGSVVVRAALYVSPRTAQITAVSDPLPSILHGIPLDLRDIRVNVDRDHFTLNPTSCEEMAVGSTITSTQGATASPSERFQVAGCERLAFKPRLGLRLYGKTNRGAHPKLRAVLSMPRGGANLARATVALPRSAFLDQAHIRTICTRVQFAAGAGNGAECPKGSIYGYAKATSPIVDYVVRGPVYLRSSDHKLPDMVLALQGPPSQPVAIEAVGRIDSIKGGIRSTFEATPDLPLNKVILYMKGGHKGLLQNSRDLCAHTYRAAARLVGHNGRTKVLRPAMSNSRCAKQRKHRRHKPAGGASVARGSTAG
jgi:hypothetical protein